MGCPRRGAAPKRSKPLVSPRRTRPPAPKAAAKRKRTPLSAEKKSLLAKFDPQKDGSLRAFCAKHDIPRNTASYHRNHSSAGARQQQYDLIVKTAQKMTTKMRIKHQSRRISAREIIEKIGKHKISFTIQHVNRIINKHFEKRPQRQRQRGQPNAESTESQMRTINAHTRFYL